MRSRAWLLWVLLYTKALSAQPWAGALPQQEPAWGWVPALSLLHVPAARNDLQGPSDAVIWRWTKPLLRARLRLPDSFSAQKVRWVKPLADGSGRYWVELAFQAHTPFGAQSQHRAWFYLRATQRPDEWIVTAAPAAP